MKEQWPCRAECRPRPQAPRCDDVGEVQVELRPERHEAQPVGVDVALRIDPVVLLVAGNRERPWDVTDDEPRRNIPRVAAVHRRLSGLGPSMRLADIDRKEALRLEEPVTEWHFEAKRIVWVNFVRPPSSSSSCVTSAPSPGPMYSVATIRSGLRTTGGVA